jgi:regulator of cell morphogenesis and NO signaling
MSPSLLHTSLADIVTLDPRTATIFDRLGLDYCCHGSQSLQDASIDRGVPVSEVVGALHSLEPRADAEDQVDPADLGALTRHIVTHHHAYVRDIEPTLKAWLAKLASRHGSRHPELNDIRALFAMLSEELLNHMTKEENMLFPYIETLWKAWQDGRSLPVSPFGTILNPIRVLEEDHSDAGALLDRLRVLTNHYTPPPDGCNTYQLCFQELKRFEADLHLHVHLENNVLFRKAIALEHALAGL